MLEFKITLRNSKKYCKISRIFTNSFIGNKESKTMIIICSKFNILYLMNLIRIHIY